MQPSRLAVINTHRSQVFYYNKRVQAAETAEQHANNVRCDKTLAADDYNKTAVTDIDLFKILPLSAAQIFVEWLSIVHTERVAAEPWWHREL